jgi:hypothetical protein
VIKRLVRAVNRDRPGKVRRLAPEPVAAALLAAHDNGARFNVERCYVPRDYRRWIKHGEYAWVRARRVGEYALYAKHGRGSYPFRMIGYRDLVP